MYETPERKLKENNEILGIPDFGNTRTNPVHKRTTSKPCTPPLGLTLVRSGGVQLIIPY
jgi:hypothetical protein